MTTQVSNPRLHYTCPILCTHKLVYPPTFCIHHFTALFAKQIYKVKDYSGKKHAGRSKQFYSEISCGLEFLCGKFTFSHVAGQPVTWLSDDCICLNLNPNESACRPTIPAINCHRLSLSRHDTNSLTKVVLLFMDIKCVFKSNLLYQKSHITIK